MSPAVLVERDLPTPMRDGVVLRADVYRPDHEGSFPVLLSRTPYGKFYADPGFALMAAEQGYAVVVQDTRGRWSSEGDPTPFIHEKEDGFDTVAWATQQPWSNGRVGMYGASYLGYTQLAAAAARPPALKTILPVMTFSDPYDMFYTGSGVLKLGTAVSWNLLAGAGMALQYLPDSTERDRRWDEFVELVNGMADGSTFRRSPIEQLPLIGRDYNVPFFLDLLSHPLRDAFWNALRCDLSDIQIPVFWIGGWYDSFIESTLVDFASYQSKGAGDTSSPHRLMIGPWVHGEFDGLNGEVDFGLGASWMLVLPEETQLRWFDRWLKGIDNGIAEEPPVRIFIMGENAWYHKPTWPLAETRDLSLYLHSAGRANSLEGDGGLSSEHPGDQPPDHFLFDSYNPAPTLGGRLCCWNPALRPGAFDQRPVEARQDVLVYSSEPLLESLEVLGAIHASLWVAVDAPDADFTAKLVDVSPDGYARNLVDGVARISQILPFGQAYSPGSVVSISIELGSTGNRFGAGHRIRLEISGSNFPRFVLNPNLKPDSQPDRHSEPVRLTVFHDREHPSHVHMPIRS